MSNLKKIIAWISVFAIIISMLCVPSFASSGSTYNQKIGFWDWAVQWSPLKGILGYTLGIGSCPTSDDGYHHANSYQADKGDGTYKCICTYCGHEFTAYESDLQQSYNDYVGTLPATGYDSSGQLRWRLNISHYDENTTVSVLSFTGGSSFVLRYLYEKVNSSASLGIYVDEFIAPVSGTYHLGAFICSSSSRFKVIQYHPAGSTKYYFFSDYSDFSVYRSSSDGIVNGVYYEFPNSLSCVSGSTVVDNTSFGLDCYSSRFYDYGGYIDVICVPVSLSGDIYNINTRPTTITGGNYGIVGDNGQITTVVDNSSIINEINNTYYNPATGKTETINSWSYDYSDRSYNITLSTGDTVTVTYGDTNITIVEGGDTYIIYYIIDGGCVDPDDPDPTPGPSDAPHEHSWQQTGRTDPTCTAPGRIDYTCERCGMTQVEVLPATGHNWQVKQSVKTTYDDDGNLIQQGYTIYECSDCGEQYKDVDGTGPPGSSGGNSDDGDSIWEKIGNFLGTILSGILGLFEAVLGKILDALISLGEMIMDKLAAVVEVVLSIFEEVPKLFGGFLVFLSAMFPFLPDDIMLLLTFGIVAVVFVGIIKAIRR